MGRRTLLLIASILVAALGTALIWLYVQGADEPCAAGRPSGQRALPGQGRVTRARTPGPWCWCRRTSPKPPLAGSGGQPAPA